MKISIPYLTDIYSFSLAIVPLCSSLFTHQEIPVHVVTGLIEVFSFFYPDHN